METSYLIAALSLFFLLLLWLRRPSRSSLRLPPGPKGYPIVGNMFDMPAEMPWKTYLEWSKVYGDVMYLDLPRFPTVVVNSAKAALDLLDKRSDIYSSRPVMIMDELMAWDFNFALAPYAEKWRTHRRAFHQYFNQREVMNHRPIQLRESRAFLKRALDSPSNLEQHIRQIYSAVIMKVTYDIDIAGMSVDYPHLAQEAVVGLSTAHVPGAYWVEYLPILKYIPSWFPGAQFKKMANYYRPIVEKMRDLPFDEIMQKIKQGKASPSLATDLIARLQSQSSGKQLDHDQEELARNVTGIAYSAGADTTSSTAQSFFIAMSLFPEVQKKGQAELDRVVGPDRLPDFSDYDELIYIQAIVLESLRWMVVVPLDNSHVNTRDDEYNGFFIPKDTNVVANAWAILHNPEEYPDPERFNPDRFIKDGRLNRDILDPSLIAFGFGRRVCPGRHWSMAALFITYASVLQTFNIHAIPDEDGKLFDPETMVVTGSISSPKCVPCKVTPRSEKAERLIRNLSSTGE